MEDIGGIIFYIIAAVIGIVTSIGSKKKKAARAASQKDTLDQEVFGESFDSGKDPIVNEKDPVLVEEAYEEEVLNDYMTEPEPVKQKLKMRFDPVSEGNYDNPIAAEHKDEGKRMTGLNKISGKEEEISEREIGSTKRILKDFDLRKAVIYSEILKRKY